MSEKINTTTTTLLDGRVRLTQPKDGFRTGIDSVFAAAYAPLGSAPSSNNDKPLQILDAGCGVGAVGLCAVQRAQALSIDYHLTGIEIAFEYAELARQNYTQNNINGTVIEGDIRTHITDLEGQFDHVICNPPYMKEGTFQNANNENRSRALGQQTGDASMQDWVMAALFYLRNGGYLTLIQRADMLDVILETMHKRFGAIDIQPLFSKGTSDSAKRILIRGIKGRKTPLRILPPLIIHEENGTYTQGAENILRNIAPCAEN